MKRYQESMKEKEARPGHKRRSGSGRRNWRHRFVYIIDTVFVHYIEMVRCVYHYKNNIH